MGDLYRELTISSPVGRNNNRAVQCQIWPVGSRSSQGQGLSRALADWRRRDRIRPTLGMLLWLCDCEFLDGQVMQTLLCGRGAIASPILNLMIILSPCGVWVSFHITLR